MSLKGQKRIFTIQLKFVSLGPKAEANPEAAHSDIGHRPFMQGAPPDEDPRSTEQYRQDDAMEIT